MLVSLTEDDKNGSFVHVIILSGSSCTTAWPSNKAHQETSSCRTKLYAIYVGTSISPQQKLASGLSLLRPREPWRRTRQVLVGARFWMAPSPPAVSGTRHKCWSTSTSKNCPQSATHSSISTGRCEAPQQFTFSRTTWWFALASCGVPVGQRGSCI